MANIFRLSLGRSGFGKSFTTPVQRPSPPPPTASYNIVLRCIDLPRIHCNHFNGQQTQKYLQPFLQRTSKKWTLNVLKDPVFLLQATRTTIPNNMEHTPLYSLSFQQSVERNYTLKNITKIAIDGWQLQCQELNICWNCMEIEEDVIRRGWRLGWITASEIYLIHKIIRKPNSIIVLLFIQNISTFFTSLTPCRLVAYFSARFQEVNRCFFLAVTFQKVDNIHRAICFAFSCIYFVQF